MGIFSPPEITTTESPAGSPVDRLRAKAVEVSKRGSKPGVARGPYKKDGAAPAPAPMVAPVTPLFNEQNFGRLVSIPFNFMAVKTQMSGWELSPIELKELSVSGVPCFNEFVGVHPKWASLTIFSISIISIAFSKSMGYLAALKQLELERRRAQTAEAKPVPAESKPEPVAKSGPSFPAEMTKPLPTLS